MIYKSAEGMTFEEKDNLWELIFEKISDAVLNGYKFTVLLGADSLFPEIDGSEEYSLIIEDHQYQTLLDNYLMWCEDLERYERCSEVKEIIELFKYSDK